MFEKHSCNYGNFGINKSSLLLEQNLRIDDIGGLNETDLSNFTCECAKLARGKQQLAMAVTVNYLIEINGKYNACSTLEVVCSYSREKCTFQSYTIFLVEKRTRPPF